MWKKRLSAGKLPKTVKKNCWTWVTDLISRKEKLLPVMFPRLFNKSGQIWLNFWGKFTLRFGKMRFRRKILMEGPSFYNQVFPENWCYFCTCYSASFLQNVKHCTLIDDGKLRCYDFRMIYAHFMHKKCFKIRFIKAKVAEKIRHFQITFFKINQTTNEI